MSACKGLKSAFHVQGLVWEQLHSQNTGVKAGDTQGLTATCASQRGKVQEGSAFPPCRAANPTHSLARGRCPSSSSGSQIWGESAKKGLWLCQE